MKKNKTIIRGLSIFCSLGITFAILLSSGCKKRLETIIPAEDETEDDEIISIEEPPKEDGKNEEESFPNELNTMPNIEGNDDSEDLDATLSIFLSKSEDWLDNENSSEFFVAVTDMNKDSIPELILSYPYNDRYHGDCIEKSYIISLSDDDEIVKEETKEPIELLSFEGGLENRKVYSDSKNIYILSDYGYYEEKAINISDCTKDSISVEGTYRNWTDVDENIEYIILYNEDFEQINLAEYKDMESKQFDGFLCEGVDIYWSVGPDKLEEALKESWDKFSYTNADFCDDLYFSKKYGAYKYADFSVINLETADLFSPMCVYDDSDIKNFIICFLEKNGTNIAENDYSSPKYAMDINEFEYIMENNFGLSYEDIILHTDKELSAVERGAVLDMNNQRIYSFDSVGDGDITLLVSDERNNDEITLEYIICNGVTGEVNKHKEVSIKKADNRYGYSLAK